MIEREQTSQQGNAQRETNPKVVLTRFGVLVGEFVPTAAVQVVNIPHTLGRIVGKAAQAMRWINRTAKTS